jgi:hypothetical protein
LLKVIAQIHLDDTLTDEQMKTAQRAAKLLQANGLSATQTEKRDQYVKLIGIEVDDTKASDLVGMVVSKA